jgi:DNA-binding CsgD family transcriptional regulator
MNEFAMLSPRELELMGLAARPMSAKEIALETGLSLGTVNNYLSGAQRRLGARNRPEAIRMFRALAISDTEKVHMNYFQVPEFAFAGASPVAELLTPGSAPLRGLADSLAPRSRASLEAFLGSEFDPIMRLPDAGSLDWKKRLYAILGLTIAIAFMLAAVVILLDALTRLTTAN